MINQENFNVPLRHRPLLSRYTTFRVGGPCRILFECPSVLSLILLTKHLYECNLDYIVIGAGSNLLVSDKGVPAAVIRFYSETPNIVRSKNRLISPACTLLDSLALSAVRDGLGGMGFVSGIPGTVGGAIAGNAGAFGRQISDVLESVNLLTPSGEIREVSKKDLKFGYRDSIFKRKPGLIILSAAFRLRPGSKEDLKKERRNILAKRRRKHPDWKSCPCAGSIFKNLVDPGTGRRTAAGLLLEQSGANNMSVGLAEVFPRHANIVVNRHGSSANDIFALIKMMREAVRNKFNVDLTREIRLVGNFPGMPEGLKGIFW